MVVRFNDIFYVFHAAVAYFNFISIKNFIEFVVFIAKVFCNEFQENLTYFSLNALGEGGIEP